MKRALFLLFFLIATLSYVEAQQRPQYTQYVFNNMLLNPAVSGIENYTDVKLGYRSQWTGLSGAPVTSYFTVNAPIGADFVNGDATASAAGGGVNPLSRLYTQYYEAAQPHHGIGFMVVNDKTGPLTQTNIDATYAYHLGLSPTWNMSVGVSAGVNHVILNTSEITLETPFDPAIANGNISQWKPDVGAGIWAYTSNFYVGASVQQLIKQNLYFSTNKTYNQSQTVPHFFFTAGTKLFLSDDVTFLPSVMVKVINPVPVSFDITGKVAFRDKFWVGGAYRHNDSFSGLVGFNINSLINVGYSYDVTTSNLNTVSNGSHEIVLGILLNNRYKVTCPQRSF
ncbi:PorP/SprF family type IX secretion system membrane protein [Mucilaginibacter ginkgonis]|uniref:Type IX secretion system membrane protein PorP/SprF n=1 Tax=Mucilaginibacter ginkgonis TaxID=2682091 RepID=A0A6I4I1W2_9SPHI|nr:type IX secretion system membrane protein PorP/SprF [Mucilaginibacter ginkgonis]QQL50609.1 type IX secretion system membrane protein PorP/SprF [Mucilaginibacter ginkgonis]